MPADAGACAAFAPGRVNIIGEHTDYNGGLALPFAIAAGITVSAEPREPDRAEGAHALAQVYARDLGEHDEFPLHTPAPASGWRAYVRGAVAELRNAGVELPALRLEIGGDLAQGAGLSSSAALTVALCMALTRLGGEPDMDRRELARLCARVENQWAGAETGLLDELASLFGEPNAALCIDFATLTVEPVPLRLGGWRFVVLDSGEHHAHAGGGYNTRRAECREACELLGVAFLSEADPEQAERLPEPLARRVAHVLGENERVARAVSSLRAADDMAAVAELLNESHASLRDLYEVSTPAVEATVARLREMGAAGARIVGGGFGGAVLALLAPGVDPPADALEVNPGQGAHLL